MLYIVHNMKTDTRDQCALATDNIRPGGGCYCAATKTSSQKCCEFSSLTHQAFWVSTRTYNLHVKWWPIFEIKRQRKK